MNTNVREMITEDVENVVDYFVKADPDYLHGMGADKSKLPARTEWMEKIKGEINKALDQKEIYYVIWQKDGKAIGHSNINKTAFAKHASMHLHIWKKENRQYGNGLDLLKQTIPIYFRNFELEKLICEPYALNPAPVKVLEQAGFQRVRTYETIPGAICFHQPVNRYEMPRSRFEEVY